MTLEEIGKLFDAIVDYYPSFTGDLRKLQSWHTTLKQVPLEEAIKNLGDYAREPDNKFPPHPGALATKRTESDRYHDNMRQSGAQTIKSYSHLREGAAPPTDEQRRRVRELLGQNALA
ncbi:MULTISPECIES: hypothetical protein [Paenibacillus]|uniref:hypothetical protein n=1 Tax=Paenibacillus TaxID=44249 RepID=UPI0021B23164|nr:hypothetical protein [Paenibacillus sp. IHBB 10380]